MKKKILTVILLGVIIRIFLALTTFHSDLQPFYFAGSVIAKGNILNFYDYLATLPANSPILSIYPTYLFNYPPLVYFFLGPISYLFSLPFSKELLTNFIFDVPKLLGNIQFNFLLLSLKLPFVVFDAGVAWILYSLFQKPANKLLALSFWIFNPINLFATYMMGQFDVIPTFFTLLALYVFVKKNKFLLSALFLGIGASFKVFPILFLVPLALTQDKWGQRIKTIVVGAIPYIVSMVPFLGSSGFRSTALLAGQTTKSFYLTLPISGGESIVVFPLLIIFFYLVFFFKKVKGEDLWRRFFVLLLAFFIITHYHPQWFVWITPFLIIDLVKSRLSHWPLVALSLVSWFGLLTFFDPGLTTRIFAPLVPSLMNAAEIWKGVDINSARSLLQTIFAAAGVYYIYLYFSRRQHG